MCVCSHSRSRSSSRLWGWTTELAHRWPYLVFIGLWLIASDGWAQGPLRRIGGRVREAIQSGGPLAPPQTPAAPGTRGPAAQTPAGAGSVHKLRHPDFHRCDRVRQVLLRRDRPGLVQIINAPQILDAPRCSARRRLSAGSRLQQAAAAGTTSSNFSARPSSRVAGNIACSARPKHFSYDQPFAQTLCCAGIQSPVENGRPPVGGARHHRNWRDSQFRSCQVGINGKRRYGDDRQSSVDASAREVYWSSQCL